MPDEVASLSASCLTLVAPTVIGVPGVLIDQYETALVPIFAGREMLITRIDRQEVRNWEQLVEQIAISCSFPARSGNNWHALKDRLLDFSWFQPTPSGFLLLYRTPELLNWTDLSEFIVVADRVREIYAQHGKPFKVLMANRSLTG